ncbi:transcriptional regulation of mitochondrial recombination-domain-containing protein [Colletotrichum navitas]|uniref:Large ribosomal subunit protein mL67 n=1 Tax=Colletotrichum navitas TaxID=681940 RepID=A0AAD8QAP7_9PEZI|nr:transcriptional regulation of mitochondrial recombination-domain-containing protein [Colletotrichum navitas]KAK1599062.1 transcriptional regulation of mitochondrial recombination-domain-containing protein [Colletotrichum navitas]
MNSVPTFRFSQLSFGVARTSIRHGHTRSRRRTPQPELTNFEPGHGEQIWVYSHLTSNQVIYSHSKQLDSNRALRQLPFNGKKTKPAKLRRDYWQPMAMIQLPPGAGAAGQSVFQKLREFRRLHELCWDESLRFAKTTDAITGVTKMRVRNRHERGVALNDQRANSIADMAAVLAGVGRGSRLHVSPQEKKAVLEEGQKLMGRKWSQEPPSPTATIAGKEGAAEDATKVVEGPDELLPATIYWANEADRNFAEKWSDNVTHDVFEDVRALLAENQFTEVVEEEAESK